MNKQELLDKIQQQESQLAELQTENKESEQALKQSPKLMLDDPE